MTDIGMIRWIFFLQPLVLGAWFPRIPQVQAALGLSEGQLAFALMGMPLGLLVALSFGGQLAERLGTRGLLSWGNTGYLLLMGLPTLARSGVTLFCALAVAGLALAIAELSLNVTAAEVEKAAERPIMNGVHGFWSLGVLLGSAIGAAQAELGLAPVWSILTIALMSAVPLIGFARRISNFVVTEQQKTSTRERFPRPLLLISAFAFGVSMTEGAMADWAAVYMTEIFAASPGVAGAGFTVFAAFVAMGRFQGDRLKSRYGVTVLARVFSGVALTGLTLALFAPEIGVAFLGLALLGYGVSLGFPLAVSAASILPGRSSAANVATLTQISLCGFLVGPLFIGLLAEWRGMRIGLAALVPALGMALVCAGALQRVTKPT